MSNAPDKTVTIRMEADDQLTPKLREVAREFTALNAAVRNASRDMEKSSRVVTNIDTMGVAARRTATRMDELRRSGDGLSRFEKRIAPIGGVVQRMGDAAEETARKYEHLGAVGDRMMIFGGAVAAGMGMAIRSLMEFDNAMARVEANAQGAGFSEQMLLEMRKEAIKVSRETAFSATEAADAMNELTKAGVSQSEILGGALVGALSLAAAGQVSVAEAAEIAATAMNQFQLDGSAVPRIADLLASGANKAQGSVHDLGFAFRQTGLQANAAGMSVADTTGVLTAFASAGLIGSDAGTSLKTMLQRMTPESEKAAETIKKLGIEAYDSKGQFVGIVEYSEKLRDGLSQLTPEARNSAMAIVFGQDAIRAANIMYEKASNEGLQSWIDKVNDAAFATRNAAILQDTLSGDVKKLKNSFNALVLESGGGINEFLRTLAQTTKMVLDAFGALPPQVTQGVAAFAAWAAITTVLNGATARMAGRFAGLGAGLRVLRDEIRQNDPATKALIKRYEEWGYSAEAATARAKEQGPRVNYLSGAMRAAGGATTGFKAAMGGLTAALGGPWGIAIGVATAALGLFAQKMAEAKQRQEEMKATTQALSEIIAANNGAWDENASRQLANQAMDAGVIDGLEKMGLSLQKVTDGLTSNGDARQEVIGAIDAHIAKLKQEGEVIDSTNGMSYNKNAQEIKQAEALRSKYLELIQVGSDAAEMGKKRTEVNDQVTKSARDAAGAEGAMADATSDAGLAAEEAEKAISAMDKAIKQLLGQAFSFEEANDAWIVGLDGIAQSAKNAAAGLTADTKAAADNRELMRQQVEDGAALIQSMAERGDSMVAMEIKANELADAFVRQAEKAGYNKEEVAKYADMLRRVPSRVPSELQLNGVDAAMEALRGVNKMLLFLKTGTTVPVRYVVEGTLPNGGRSTAGGLTRADGGVVEFYAAGGVREEHRAEIAPAGAWRVWAEPETGGEAYLPLAKSKRTRSVQILEEVARRFGMGVVKFAEGGITQYASGGVTVPAVPATRSTSTKLATIQVKAEVVDVSVKRGVRAPFLYTPGGTWDRSTERPPMNASAITSRFDELYVSKEELLEAARRHYEARKALADNSMKMAEKSDANAKKLADRVRSAEIADQSADAALERVERNRKATRKQLEVARAKAREAERKKQEARAAASREGIDYFGVLPGSSSSGSGSSSLSAARVAGRAAGAAAVANTKAYVRSGKQAVKRGIDADTLRGAAVMNALSMDGRGRYVWGGGHTADYYKNEAALAADCSGFVGWAIGRALGRNVTGTAATMLSGKTGGFIKIDPKLAVKVAGAIMGHKGHVVMSLGDGRVIESYSKGKPVRIRKVAARDMKMAAWNTGFGSISEAAVGGGVVGGGVVDAARMRELQQDVETTRKEYQELLKRYKTPAYVHLATATKQENQYQASFLANIRKIRDRGFPSLAFRLMEMGDEQGATIAASMANAPDKVLRQQRDMFEQNAKQSEYQQRLQESLAKVAGPAAYVTASKEAQATNARRKQWMRGIAQIYKVNPVLAKSLFDEGMETSFDLVMSIKDKPAVAMRNLEHNRNRDVKLLDAQEERLGKTLAGPAWKTSKTEITKKVAASAKFMSALETLRRNGYSDLARRYYDMGEEVAGEEALSMAAASNTEREQMRKVYASQDASEKKWKDLGDLLHNVGKVIDVAIGVASATDPAIRYLTPSPVDARSPSLQLLLGGKSQPQPATRSAPLLNVETMITENPGRAVVDMSTKLGDVMAVTGLGGAML